MERDTTPTEVLFRKYPDGEVLAVMPGLAGSSDRFTCMGYAHVGQHSNVDPSGVIALTRPATPDEYAPLLRELEGLGYMVQPIKRQRPAHMLARMAQLKRD